MPILTERLILRHWRQSDLQPFRELNASPAVMEFFPATLSCEQSDALATEIQKKIERNGWGLWAVEERSSGEFVGFVGLNQPSVDLPFGPCIEVGWRLASQFWGQGYATEAGKRALEFAFDELSLSEVVSFTAVPNLRSAAVMRRLGMTNTNENFQHPSVPTGSWLCEHVLYRITALCWQESGS